MLLVVSAGSKFVPGSEMSTQLLNFGFDGYKVILIAVEEVISALLFLIPSTRRIGVLLVSAHMGGALATHLQHSQSFLPLLPAAMVLVLAWSGTWLCNPEIFWALYQPTTRWL
jgi:hypothetical protein